MLQVAEAHIWAKGGHCFEIGVSEEIGSRETGALSGGSFAGWCLLLAWTCLLPEVWQGPFMYCVVVVVVVVVAAVKSLSTRSQAPSALQSDIA